MKPWKKKLTHLKPRIKNWKPRWHFGLKLLGQWYPRPSLQVNWRLKAVPPMWCWLGYGNELAGWRSEWQWSLCGSYLFFETQSKFACYSGSVPALGGIFYTSVAGPEDDIPENQTSMHVLRETLSLKLTNWVRRPGTFPWCNMNSLKLKNKSESFFVDFCWQEWFDVVNSDLLIVVFYVYK